MNQRPTEHERTERRLRALLKQECPSPLALGEYQMKLLPSEEAASIAAHLERCPHCVHEVHQLDQFLDPSDAVPLLEEIREIVLEWGRNLLAPRPGLALAGVRGSAVRAQTFSAAHLWLALTVQEAEDGGRNLLALVTREDGCPLEHGSAWLSQENRLIMGGRIDAFGNLVIAGVQPGQYDLGIQCDGTRVWIRGVSV